MSRCCSAASNAEVRSRMLCPFCTGQMSSVERRTVLLHVSEPWRWSVVPEAMGFCESADCDCVYAAEDGIVIRQQDMRTTVGIKSMAGDAMLCYCYGITRATAEENAHLRSFVIDQTRQGECACDTMNPCGRCCLKSYPKNPSEPVNQ